MKKLLVLSLSVALLGAGCSTSPSRPSAEGPGSSIAVGEPNPSAPSGTSCTNAYFPAKKGFSVTYKTNYGKSNGEYTSTVKEVRADGLNVEMSFSAYDIVMNQEYVCDGQSMKAKGYADLGSAISGSKVSFETVSQEGFYLPEKLDVGTKWESTVDVVGSIEGGALAQAGVTKLKEKINVKSEALAKERVTVEAGEFDAVKVKQVMDIDIDTGLTKGVPMKLNTVTYVWFAKGIGMIKSETVSNGTTSTIEAISINK